MEKKVKIRELKKEERLSYIWEYYRWHILGIILAIAAVIFVLVHIFTPQKEVALRICAVNVDGSIIKDNSYFNEFMKKNQYDLDKETLDVNFNLTIDLKDVNGTAQTTLQSIYTLINAGAVDVFMSDEELFQNLANDEVFEPLEDYVSKDFLKKYKKDLIYGKSAETGESYIAGVRLPKNSRFIKDNIFYVTPAVIGFSGPKAQNYTAQKQFLKYAFEEKR